MIKADMRQVRQLENTLERLNARGLAFAEIETVNRAAFDTQKDARASLGKRMTLRNSWSERSIQTQKAHRGRLESSVGSTQGYMETQQTGGVETASGSHGVLIPTAFASGEGRASQRKRLVRKPNQASRITLGKGTRKTMSRKQQLLLKVRESIESGKRVVFHDFGAGKAVGLFRIKGGSRATKRGWPKGARMHMLYDMSRKQTTTPKNPWLTDAAAGPTRNLPRYYATAIARQLKRLRY